MRKRLRSFGAATALPGEHCVAVASAAGPVPPVASVCALGPLAAAVPAVPGRAASAFVEAETVDAAGAAWHVGFAAGYDATSRAAALRCLLDRAPAHVAVVAMAAASAGVAVSVAEGTAVSPADVLSHTVVQLVTAMRFLPAPAVAREVLALCGAAPGVPENDSEPSAEPLALPAGLTAAVGGPLPSFAAALDCCVDALWGARGLPSAVTAAVLTQLAATSRGGACAVLAVLTRRLCHTRRLAAPEVAVAAQVAAHFGFELNWDLVAAALPAALANVEDLLHALRRRTFAERLERLLPPSLAALLPRGPAPDPPPRYAAAVAEFRALLTRQPDADDANALLLRFRFAADVAASGAAARPRGQHDPALVAVCILTAGEGHRSRASYAAELLGPVLRSLTSHGVAVPWGAVLEELGASVPAEQRRGTWGDLLAVVSALHAAGHIANPAAAALGCPSLRPHLPTAEVSAALHSWLAVAEAHAPVDGADEVALLRHVALAQSAVEALAAAVLAVPAAAWVSGAVAQLSAVVRAVGYLYRTKAGLDLSSAVGSACDALCAAALPEAEAAVVRDVADWVDAQRSQ